MALMKPVIAQGKHLLIRAALKLAMKTRSVQALGVREIGREAGLNPNTFYRHFSSLDDLGLSILNEVIGNIRQPLRDMRREAASSIAGQVPNARLPSEYWVLSLQKTKLVARETIRRYFEFVLKNPEAFTIGVSELNGASSTMRQAIQGLIADFASDLADDIRILQLLPMVSDAGVRELSTIIIRQIFMLSTDYIDTPEKRGEMEDVAYSFMINLIAGTIGLEMSDQDTLTELLAVLRSEG
jgi:AcrR family transcriptional regulator